MALATATFATTALSVGTDSITAVYSGDPNFTASTSAVLPQVVNQASSSTTETADVNPSVFGQSVTLIASVEAVKPVPAYPAAPSRSCMAPPIWVTVRWTIRERPHS